MKSTFHKKKLVKSNTHIFITIHPQKKNSFKMIRISISRVFMTYIHTKKAHFLTHCVKFSLTCWSTWGPARFWNRGIRPSMEAITQPAHSLPSSSLPYVGAYKQKSPDILYVIDYWKYQLPIIEQNTQRKYTIFKHIHNMCTRYVVLINIDVHNR